MLHMNDEDGLGVATLLRAPPVPGRRRHGAQALQADAGGIDVSGMAKVRRMRWALAGLLRAGRVQGTGRSTGAQPANGCCARCSAACVVSLPERVQCIPRSGSDKAAKMSQQLQLQVSHACWRSPWA